MPVLRLFDIQTESNEFTLALSSTSNGFEARYWSTTTNAAKASDPKKTLSGLLTHADASAALDAAFDQIEAMHGPLMTVDESKMTGEKLSILREDKKA